MKCTTVRRPIPRNISIRTAAIVTPPANHHQQQMARISINITMAPDPILWGMAAMAEAMGTAIDTACRDLKFRITVHPLTRTTMTVTRIQKQPEKVQATKIYWGLHSVPSWDLPWSKL